MRGNHRTVVVEFALGEKDQRQASELMRVVATDVAEAMGAETVAFRMEEPLQIDAPVDYEAMMDRMIDKLKGKEDWMGPG